MCVQQAAARGGQRLVARTKLRSSCPRDGLELKMLCDLKQEATEATWGSFVLEPQCHIPKAGLRSSSDRHTCCRSKPLLEASMIFQHIMPQYNTRLVHRCAALSLSPSRAAGDVNPKRHSPPSHEESHRGCNIVSSRRWLVLFV